MKLKPEWLEWAKATLAPIKHNGLIYMPVRELCYRLDKDNSRLLLVYEGEGYDRVYKAINEEVFKAVGFPVVDGERITKEEMLANLDQKKVVIDRPSLIRGMLERSRRKE